MNTANHGCDVFISYATPEIRHAEEIDSFLRARGLRPYFDRRNIMPGLPWVPALERAIDAAMAVIVLIGPAGLGNIRKYERQFAVFR